MADHYKTVRKLARRLGLRDSLTHIWFYSLRSGYGFDLPFEYRHPRDVKDHVREFHLDLYVREVVLHATRSADATLDLQNWGDLSTFHNAILRHSNAESASSSNIYLTLHRLGHQQISAFDRVNANFLGRYWLLFNREPIASFVRHVFGMTVLEYFLFVAGIFMIYTLKAESDLVDELFVLDISPAALRNRIDAICTDRTSLRQKLVKHQRFDATWEYTFNPIVSTPLVRLKAEHPYRLICPRPQLVVRRLLEGVYFDLIGFAGFSKAYGDSVESMVGDLIRVAGSELELRKPGTYKTPQGDRHGADWILSDSSGHVFVECKTARIRADTKIASKVDDIRQGMTRLAEAVVQNYRNIQDVIDGIGDTAFTSKPMFSLVVTLEDWNLFSSVASESLRSAIEDEMERRHLPKVLLQSVPYLVVPVNDLPDLTAAIAVKGVSELFANKCSGKYDQYIVSAYLDETKQRSGASSAIFQASTDELFREFNARFKSSPSTSA